MGFFHIVTNLHFIFYFNRNFIWDFEGILFHNKRYLNDFKKKFNINNTWKPIITGLKVPSPVPFWIKKWIMSNEYYRWFHGLYSRSYSSYESLSEPVAFCVDYIFLLINSEYMYIIIQCEPTYKSCCLAQWWMHYC